MPAVMIGLASPLRRATLLGLGALLLAFALQACGGTSGGGLAPGSTSHRTAQARHATVTHRSAGHGGTSARPRRDLGVPGPPRPVPILMYHVISEPLPRSPYPDLYVPRAQFADQMQALKRAGYTAVTLGEAWASWHDRGPLPRRPVVVSFDDGYRSHFTNALPVLRALGWPGVLNLELKNIRPDYGLTDGQVRALIAAGWEVDSHTIDHPDLRTVDAARLDHELVDSRAEIHRRFGVPASFFCYPAGKYDATVIAAVQRAGYLAATTTNPGLAQPAEADRFALNRVRVNNGVSGATLVSQLAGMGAARAS
jgi:peptidoglycan/xylan/chitin deacetylase (PgdA/CDA1 family)